MCGIFGSPTLTPSVMRMLPYLGIEMLNRGKDAWGGSDGTELVKHKGPIIETWAEEEERVSAWQAGIFHTRGASSNTPKEAQNAHPFQFTKEDGTTVIGIHNGVIVNHEDLDKKYGRNCEVDSEHIWMHRAEGRPWTDLVGWGNLVWWETDAETGQRRMNMLRFNTDNLKVAKLRGGEYVFCSEQGAVQKIAQMLGNPVERWAAIDEGHQYWFQPGDDGRPEIWRSGTKQEFPRTVVSQHCIPVSQGGSGRHHRGPQCHTGGALDPWTGIGTYCFKCNTVKVKEEEEVVCWSCMRGLTEMYLSKGAEAWIA